MLIDWFTVAAQALNFLVLVWLMKRFLYKPILHAIDAREKRIADELSDAASRKAEAQKERNDFQHKNEAFEQERAEMVNKATEEATLQRQRLMDEARRAADEVSEKRERSLREEAGHLNQVITRRTQDEVFSISRKVLSDLASTSLEKQIGAVFIRRLREVDAQERSDLENALKNASEPALVRSAFELSPDQQAAIQEVANETFLLDTPLRFEQNPDLVSGIELISNGQKISWSIKDYLKSMEESVSELLEKKTNTKLAAAVDQAAKSERQEAIL